MVILATQPAFASTHKRPPPSPTPPYLIHKVVTRIYTPLYVILFCIEYGKGALSPAPDGPTSPLVPRWGRHFF